MMPFKDVSHSKIHNTGGWQTFGGHHILKSVAFDQKLFIALLALRIRLVSNVDDCTRDRGNALRDRIISRQSSIDRSKHTFTTTSGSAL